MNVDSISLFSINPVSVLSLAQRILSITNYFPQNQDTSFKQIDSKVVGKLIIDNEIADCLKCKRLRMFRVTTATPEKNICLISSMLMPHLFTKGLLCRKSSFWPGSLSIAQSPTKNICIRSGVGNKHTKKYKLIKCSI
jgi:hypothetical protein